MTALRLGRLGAWSAASVLGASLAYAQAPAPAPAPAQDFSKIEIKTTKLTEHFYTLEGSGGTIGVLVGPDGAFMVDSQYAPLTEKIVAAIKQLTPGPIRFMVNTHLHPDHTGGNENLGKMGVTILGRDQLRARMAGAARPAPPAALPLITYDVPTTIHMNGEDIQLIPVKAAHTDGDTMVWFPNNDVLMTGDFYRAIGYPFPDLNNGGTVKGLVDGLLGVITLARSTTRIVPGHGAVVTKAEVAAHLFTTLAVRDKVDALIGQAKSADDIVAAKPTADFDASVLQAATTSERFIRAIVTERKSAP